MIWEADDVEVTAKTDIYTEFMSILRTHFLKLIFTVRGPLLRTHFLKSTFTIEYAYEYGSPTVDFAKSRPGPTIFPMYFTLHEGLSHTIGVAEEQAYEVWCMFPAPTNPLREPRAEQIFVESKRIPSTSSVLLHQDKVHIHFPRTVYHR
jgi:hypothetical protein